MRPSYASLYAVEYKEIFFFKTRHRWSHELTLLRLNDLYVLPARPKKNQPGQLITPYELGASRGGGQNRGQQWESGQRHGRVARAWERGQRRGKVARGMGNGIGKFREV